MIGLIIIILLAIDIIMVITAVANVLLEELQPFKAMFWIMTIVFVPILGFILYYFFGKSLHKKRLMSDRTQLLMAEHTIKEFVSQDDLVIPARHERIINFFTSTCMAFPFKNNQVEFLTEGANFFLSLLRDIGAARSHIHIVTYIISDDALGRLIADALIDKTRQGVEVRMVYDDVGCWKTPNSFFNRLSKAGVDVKPFLPVRFPALTGKVNYRNHQKICVIDGKTGYIGGMNIALRYAKGRRGHTWCDTHVRIQGAAVSSLQSAFVDDWYIVSRSKLCDDKYYPPTTIAPNDCLAQVVLSSPLMQWNGLMQGFISMIYLAHKYVYLETPYFIPPQPILLALTTRALAGVDIRIILPEHTDQWFVEHASRQYIDKAYEAGVKFYLYTPGINHTKMFVCDDSLCSCGSTNIDFRSFENNCEANLFVYNTEKALEMRQLFTEDLKYCTPLSQNTIFNHHTIRQRLIDGAIRMLSPLM